MSNRKIRRILLPLSVALPVLLLAGCATRPATVVEVQKICPVPLTADELNKAADAIDALPAGEPLDYLAGLVERLDEAAVECWN